MNDLVLKCTSRVGSLSEQQKNSLKDMSDATFESTLKYVLSPVENAATAPSLKKLIADAVMNEIGINDVKIYNRIYESMEGKT